MIIRNLPAVETRVESGPIQFGDDWPGTFIRGDTAALYAITLDAYMKGSRDPISDAIMRGLLQSLTSSRV